MESDSTIVTGSPAGLKAPRAGTVVCERFEIRDVIERDALVLTYRAIDQETDREVLVRTTAPGVLGEREATRALERLRPLIGAHPQTGPDGKPQPSVWPGLIDADREGPLVSTVEPFPVGTTFQSVLEARRVKRKRFDAAELLPFVARIAAALDGLPDRGPLSGLHHADLRANRIFVHPDGISLTGGFLLAALPGDAVAEVLTKEVALRRVLPPEFAEGLAGRPADRHAVAALAWEALEGKPPPPSVRAGDCRSEPALGAILVRYLDPDPAVRPATLRSLVEALAARAALPVPEHTDRLVLVGGEPESDEAPTTATGSYELRDDELVPAEGSITDKRPRGSDLDPDLVAAAKAASQISETGTFQLEAEELVPVRPLSGQAKSGGRTSDPGTPAAKPSPLPKRTEKKTAPLGAMPLPNAPAATPTAAAVPQAKARAKGRPRADRTEELGEQDLVDVVSATKQPAHAHVAQTRAKPAAAKAAASQTPAGHVAAAQAVAAQEARPRAAWEHSALPSSGAPLPSLQPALAPGAAAAAAAAVAAGTGAPTRDGPGPGGIILIVAAVLLAGLILGAAFWYRAHEEQVRHEQEIEQRLRDLRP